MSKKILVKQNDIKDCGPCCLLSIIKYYNGYIPLEKIRLDARTTVNGTTAYNLIEAAKKYGFNSYGIKSEKLDNNLLLPAIAHVITKKGYNHFVVIYKIKDKYVYIMDPGKGLRKEKIEDFKKEWTNVILVFKPYKKIPLYKIRNSLKELSIEILKSESKYIKKIIILDIIVVLLSIISSYYLQISLSFINNKSFIIILIIIFLLFNLYKIIFNYYRNTLAIYLNKNINIKIMPEFISHIFKLPSSVITSRTSGEIITRVQEMNSIKELFTEILVTISLDSFLTISSMFFLYRINSELFLILCTISIIYIVIGFITNPIIYRSINENIDSETEFNSVLTESVNNIESIKNLNLINKNQNNVDNVFVKYQENLLNYNNTMNRIITIKNIIEIIGLFLINSYGIIMISQNKLELIQLVTFNTLLSYFLNPIINTINLIPKYNLIKLSFIKINEFISIEEEKEGKEEEFINGNIEFHNISYGYDKDNYIIKNININVPKNSHNMIIGSSGIGKSTLVKMLNKSINDYKGDIRINNINIKDYSLKTIRKNILYVSQRERLFQDTILENLTLGKNVSKKELNEIIKLTEVEKILNKKSLRLNSFIYDNGYNLSGGEKQRLILARSLLKKPKILILDESLSELDEKSEMKILNNIDSYLKETTILYISHSSVKSFTNIINMEKANA